ncbi:hypothetical protein OROHE_020606 [Orobanche hederae]
MEDNQQSSKETAAENDDNNITLRLMDLSDIDDFMAWATDDKVSQFCTWKTCTSKEEAMTYMINSVIPHPWMRAICLKNRAIGYIMLTAFEGNDACRCEVGYVLASKYWGKGIATRALKMVASTIFHERTHLERLDAWVDKDNLGSHRVLVKAGFQKEGVLRKYMLIKGKPRDMVVFSLLSTDPQVN